MHKHYLVICHISSITRVFLGHPCTKIRIKKRNTNMLRICSNLLKFLSVAPNDQGSTLVTWPVNMTQPCLFPSPSEGDHCDMNGVHRKFVSPAPRNKKSVAMAWPLVARCCRKSNQLRCVQGLQCKEPQERFLSPRNMKCCYGNICCQVLPKN